MEKSQTISELAKALNKFQSMMGPVIFDANNPFYKSKYATLSAIVSKAKPYLTESGLSVSQLLEGDGGVTTILMHSSGEYLSSALFLKSIKDDPQGHGSAITYARRYAYASILGIVSDEDDDANASIKSENSQEKLVISPVIGIRGLNSKKSAPTVLKTKNNAMDKPGADTDEQKINKEQGEALLILIKNNNWSKEDLKEYISFQFNLENLSDICNKHLFEIRHYFSEPKEMKAR